MTLSSIKYRHIFIKPYISYKTLLVYSTIHFRHYQELNDIKTKWQKQSMLQCYKNVKYSNKMNCQKGQKNPLKSSNKNYHLLLHVKVLQQFTKHKEQRQLDWIY